METNEKFSFLLKQNEEKEKQEINGIEGPQTDVNIFFNDNYIGSLQTLDLAGLNGGTYRTRETAPVFEMGTPGPRTFQREGRIRGMLLDMAELRGDADGDR